MRNYFIQVFVFTLVMTTFTGCSLVGDIFEAGVWIGVIVVVLVIVFIIWIVKKLL